MNNLEIEPRNVHLKGLSRSASFQIHNHHQFLAASFNLSFKKGSSLSVFPTKGVLMQGQSQKVKVRCLNEVEELSQELQVRWSFKIEYNRQLLLKKELGGWEQIRSEKESLKVQVKVGGERQAIQEHIRQDIILKQQFAKQSQDLSAIQPSNSISLNEASLTQLNIYPNRSHSSVIQKESCVLPIDDIYPLSYGQSRLNPISERSQLKIESRVNSETREKNGKGDILMKTVDEKDWAVDRGRSLQVLILAVVAAFFVSLGNNLGRLVR